MKNMSIKLFSLGIFALILVIAGCKKKEEPAEVVASFQFAASSSNWATIEFSNFSQNATSYSWDFGDGNTSTEESPSHTYEAAGDYEVTLTATGDEGSDSQTKTVTVVDPDEALTFLTGTAGKTWHLDRSGIALGIGPTAGDNAWWSFGGVTPLGDRPCILDDSYTFNPDGSFDMNTANTLFVDADANGGWLGSTESCYDESQAGVFTGPSGEDLSAFANGGAYTFTYDASGGTITIDGEGAYIGLCNKTETGDNFVPVNTKKYTIFGMGEGDIADTLNIAIIAADGSFSWNFYLLSYHNPADLPDIPAAQPAADFSASTNGLEVTFTNSSKNSTTYSWDFGDGNTSTDENPVHTYAADGDYDVTLTASDASGASDQTTKTVTVSSATFAAANLSTANGKTWKLDGEASYYVGPCAGCNDWWGGIDAQGVIDRACQLDDEFIFFDDGTFQIDTKGDVWVENFLKGADECISEDSLISPFDAFKSGTHSFTATDSTVTVNGTGAYLGWNKPYNGGELPNDGSGTPASSITYTVHDYSDLAGVEKLTVTIDYGTTPGGSFWTMRLIAQ
jgi:PKD repeat protein